MAGEIDESGWPAQRAASEARLEVFLDDATGYSRSKDIEPQPIIDLDSASLKDVVLSPPDSVVRLSSEHKGQLDEIQQRRGRSQDIINTEGPE